MRGFRFTGIAVVVIFAATAGCSSSPVGGDRADTAPGGSAGSTGPGAGAAPVATARPSVLRFDPGHLAVQVDYPTQPPGVAWPTGGWQEAPLPAEVDSARLQAVLDRAFGEQSTGLNHQFDAALAVHRGRIVFERYRPGFGDQTTVHRSWSMAKSYTQALVGILVRDGKLEVRAPAPVPEWSDPTDPRHLITTDEMIRMASGLAWKEDYFAPDSDTLAMLGGAGKADMAHYAASKPLEVPPDSRVRYSTGTTCIVSGVIGSIVGRGDRYKAFIQQELLDPLGVLSADTSPGFDGAGNLVGGSVFDANARAFAKLGYLYLRGGKWDGRQILPEGWVDYARTATPAPAGTPGYGAGWWVEPKHPGEFRAGGFGGQHIVVVPQKDLVVVLLSDRMDGLDGDVRDDLVAAFDAVPDVTVPRVIDPASVPTNSG